MRYRARGVALLQKLLNHTTGPGLAARILVHSVQHVVQNSAPADRLVECTADWVVVLYLPCLGVDFFVQPYRGRRVAPLAAGNLTAALKSISGTQKSHTARQGDKRTHEFGHNLPY